MTNIHDIHPLNHNVMISAAEIVRSSILSLGEFRADQN